MNTRMTMKTLLLLLLDPFTLLSGVHPRTPDVLYVRAGEMVALHCPQYNQQSSESGELFWTHHTSKQMNLTKDMSTSAQQRQMDVLLHGRSLVILRASENHKGNYSCSFGKSKCECWFGLTVYPAESNEYERTPQYPVTCFTQESCTLTCPDVNTPPLNTPDMSSSGIIWHKDGDPSAVDSYFSSADEKDGGVYSCTRSYLYHGQVYFKTFRVTLEVKPIQKFQVSRITEPQEHQVFYVDLDSPTVIDCKAVLYSEFDEVFWLSDDSFVEQNTSLPVFYNYTRDQDAEETRVTASLIFRKVSGEDLSKHYTCKLDSDHQLSTFVTITLTPNAGPSSLRLALCIVCIPLVILLTVFFSMRYHRWKTL